MDETRIHSDTMANASCNELNALLDEAFSIGLMQVREEIFTLCALVSCLRPRNVLEIGSGHGGTFFLWCRLGGDGVKISLDLAGGPYGGEPNGDERVLRARNERMQSWAPATHLISGHSRAPATLAEANRVLGGNKLDMLFIDGDHTYEAVSHDYKTFGQLVAPGGIVVFHDINDSDFHRANNVGVARLWGEIEGTRLEVTCRQHWGGLGILWVG